MASPDCQRTLAGSATLEGVGLHGGKPVRMTLEPGPPDAGVVFVRDDLPGTPTIPADRRFVVPGSRETLLRRDGHEVHTVEHLLAAAAGLGVDNLVVRLDAPEPPAMDGSAAAFVAAIQEAGVIDQDPPRRRYQVLFPVTYHSGRGSVTALPCEDFRITLTLEYPGTAIGTQSRTVVVDPDTFRTEIMDARTFCLRQEVEQLRSAGLALGGSLENAVVVDGDQIMNPQGLRHPDEFVRHKILDMIGDLSLAGARIHGHFLAYRSGHLQNTRLIERLFKDGALAATKAATPSVPLDIRAIQKILPHRYPFLLVDRITELEVGKRALGVKAVTIDEPFFQGHFPGRPIMPGVLIMEALAQVAGVTMLCQPSFQGKTPFFTGLDGVVFRQPIVPGDLVELEIEVEKVKLSMGRAKGTARVGGQVAATGTLKFTLID